MGEEVGGIVVREGTKRSRLLVASVDGVVVRMKGCRAAKGDARRSVTCMHDISKGRHAAARRGWRREVGRAGRCPGFTLARASLSIPCGKAARPDLSALPCCIIHIHIRQETLQQDDGPPPSIYQSAKSSTAIHVPQPPWYLSSLSHPIHPPPPSTFSIPSSSSPRLKLAPRGLVAILGNRISTSYFGKLFCREHHRPGILAL